MSKRLEIDTDDLKIPKFDRLENKFQPVKAAAQFVILDQ